MTIDELISELEDARENMPNGGDTEIRVAYQPSWPLRATLENVTIPDEPVEHPEGTPDPYGDDSDGSEYRVDPADARFLWLALAGGQPYDENPYAPRWAWQS